MNLGLGLALPTFPLRGGIDQFIRSMFAGGEQGAWYDPSDLSTMFQGGSGNLNVSATGQTVALILDKRLGMTRGAEMVISPYGGSVGAGWTINASSIVRSGATATNAVLNVSPSFEVGAAYEISFTVSGLSGDSLTCVPYGTTGVNAGQISADGVYTRIVYAISDSLTLSFIPWAGSAGNATITNISAKKIAGNHAYQTTAASRPIFRDVAGVRYLEFDGVDDYLSATYALAQPVNRISAFASATIASSDRVFDGGGGSRISLLQDPGVLYTYGGTGYVGPVAIVAGTNYVITELFSGASSKLAKNNEAYATGNAGSADQIVSVIGASTGGAAAANIHLHQMIMRGSTTAMTDAQIAACRALCAAKSGVTL